MGAGKSYTVKQVDLINYEGEGFDCNGYKIPHGYGKTESFGAIYEGKWVNGKRHGDFTIRFNNGFKRYVKYVKYKDGEMETKCKCVVRIRKEDFKLDIPYLTDFLRHGDKNPDSLNDSNSYGLTFEGELEDDSCPLEGDLSIREIFQFSGKWRNWKPHCKGILYNIKEKTAKEIHFVDGVEMRLESANNSNQVVASTHKTDSEEGQSN
jgi:hypothetical protein